MTVFQGVVLTIAAVIASPVFGQEWTEEERTLLAWQEGCVRRAVADFANLHECFHEDFKGWSLDSNNVQTKEERLAEMRGDFEKFDTELMSLEPLSVHISGDIAVILYLTTAKRTNKETGETRAATLRTTDVCVRQGRTWAWIADQTVVVPL